MHEKKERLDILLVRRNYFPSRQQAQAAIMAGLIVVDGEKIEKAGTRVTREAIIRILGKTHPYVSRGGLKLEKALQHFNISLEKKIVMDVGASTGGFTDCALQYGAEKVYAVDVGFGQLDWKLRQDKRVVVMEKTNIRYLEAKAIPEPVDFVCIDVSFISLAKVLPKIIEVLKPKSEIVALVKPQFEAGPDQVGKGGIVRSPKVHVEVLLQVVNFALELGLIMGGITFSPITGAKGNIEYLLYLVKNGAHQAKPLTMIADIVTDAWKEV